jgi:hypothetical protein
MYILTYIFKNKVGPSKLIYTIVKSVKSLTSMIMHAPSISDKKSDLNIYEQRKYTKECPRKKMVKETLEWLPKGCTVPEDLVFKAF